MTAKERLRLRLAPIKVFLWEEGRGCLFQRYSPSEGLLTGGGGEGSAIQIFPGLLHGVSRRSHTYDNDPLSGSGTGEFEILRLEIWSLSWRGIDDTETGPIGSFFSEGAAL